MRHIPDRATDRGLDLLGGALLVARNEYPNLDEAAVVREIDALGATLALRLADHASAEAQARELARLLVDEEGFCGDETGYRDARNSYVNDVLARRRGIPITLSVVWVEVARRAGIAASSVPFHGYFLVRLDGPKPGSRVLVDPCSDGRVVTDSTLVRLREASTGAPIVPDERELAPADGRMVVVRLLLNLRSLHAARGDYSRLLVVLDRLVDLLPGSPEQLRDRGLVTARMGAPLAARADLEEYVRLAPRAEDVEHVRRVISRLAERDDAAAS